MNASASCTNNKNNKAGQDGNNDPSLPAYALDLFVFCPLHSDYAASSESDEESAEEMHSAHSTTASAMCSLGLEQRSAST